MRCAGARRRISGSRCDAGGSCGARWRAWVAPQLKSRIQRGETLNRSCVVSSGIDFERFRLGHAAIVNLRGAPRLLNSPKRVLAQRAHPHADSIGVIGRGRAAPPIGRFAMATPNPPLATFRLAIRRVAMNVGRPAVQQLWEVRQVGGGCALWWRTHGLVTVIGVSQRLASIPACATSIRPARASLANRTFGSLLCRLGDSDAGTRTATRSLRARA